MRTILLSAAALALAACAAGPTGPDAVKRFDSFDAVETTDFRGYDKVEVLAPEAGPEVAERIGMRSPIALSDRKRPLSQRDVDQQLGELEGDLRREIGKVAMVVDEGGPGILTVRTVVTDLNANRPTQIELAQNPGLSFNSIATGDAAARVELLEDGRLLAVIEDRDNVTSLADPEAQVAGIWTTADRYFERLARRMGALLSD